MSNIYDYIRVSTREQNEDRQLIWRILTKEKGVDIVVLDCRFWIPGGAKA